ncbi:MAG: T9SS type A sorting domain-containing protein, partial [Candidatus Cloacimonetes bacterium]|nr:T9SS type A sorting domain-containing protein [Candidatus Cloacimonadota bacterium]
FTDAVRPVDSDAIDTQFQLVDFAVQVLKSPQAGGSGRNVNEVRLYQGNTWRANLAQSGEAGEYHIDVVDGVDLRAYCILEGLGAFGATLRPADSAELDDTIQLVDFFIALDSQECQAVPLSEVRLYQGNTWRGNFSLASPVQELHHDVVPGVNVRAWLSRSGIGTFTDACIPGTQPDQPDLILAAPTVRFDPLDGASQARLYEGNTHRMTLNRSPEGDFRVVLVEGMSGLRFWISSTFSPEFAVSTQSGTLADDGTSLIQSSVDSCWELNDDVAATVLTDLSAAPGAAGLVELSWTLLDGHSFVLFHLQRDGIWLNTGIPVEEGIREYRFVDPEPAVGSVSWRIWGEALDGTQLLLAELTSQALPESFELLGAWPNPFNPDTRLRLSLDRERDVQLSVYNLQGARVAELHRGVLPAGQHEVTFSGVGLASGVYLVRLQSGDAQRSMKVMLVK